MSELGCRVSKTQEPLDGRPRTIRCLPRRNLSSTQQQLMVWSSMYSLGHMVSYQPGSTRVHVLVYTELTNSVSSRLKMSMYNVMKTLLCWLALTSHCSTSASCIHVVLVYVILVSILLLAKTRSSI